MLSITTFIAVALSLSSTNDYAFFKSFPTNADIRGIGMGKDVLYVIPRLEDVAFMNEAWHERAEALGYCSTNDMFALSLPSGPIPFGYEMFRIQDSLTVRLFPESYDGLEEYRDYGRGHVPSYVDGSFSLGGSDSGFVECDDHWRMGINTNFSVRSSYIPILGQGYERLVPPNLVTNSGATAGTVLKLGNMAAMYTNLCYATHIVSTRAPSPTSNIDMISRNGSSGLRRTTVRNRTASARYTYTHYDFDGGDWPYASSYTLESNDETHGYDSPAEDLPLAESWFYFQVNTSHPFSQKQTGENSWELATVMQPYIRRKSNQLHEPEEYSKATVYTPLVTNISSFSSMKCWIVLGVTRTCSDLKERFNYDGSIHEYSSTTNRIISTREVSLIDSGSTIRDGDRDCIVFRTDFSFEDEIRRAKAYFNEPDYLEFDAEPVYPDSATIANSGTGYAKRDSSLEGRRTIETIISISWARAIFLLKPIFKSFTMDE